MVKCKMDKCPYNEGSICSRAIVVLNPMGICAYLYDDSGNARPNALKRTKEDIKNADISEIHLGSGNQHTCDEGEEHKQVSE